MRKAATLLLATILSASMVPSNLLISYAVENTTVISSENNDTKSEGTSIKVKKAWGNPSKQAKITLSIENNPGIVGLTLQISYDESAMTLSNAENGTAIKGKNITFTPPANGSNFVWSGTSVKSDEVSDGTLLTLTFDISENAKLGEYPISVSCLNAVDNELKKVPIKIDSSSISIIDYMPGDTSGDGDLAMNDLVLLVRYIADGGYNEKGYAAKVDERACDVDSDGDITVIDAVLLSRYIADRGWNPNGYNVELQPAPFQCNHSSLKHIEAVEAASCQKNGNIEYWYCEDCDKYYSDELCNNEITKEDTVVKGEHTVVIDEAVAPTTDKNGLTEGSHCSVCGEILTKQEIVKPQGDYSITYNIVGSDTYLASLNIQNPNRKYYSSGEVFRLDDLEVPGYTFEGWYDGQGKTANKVTSIKADDTGNLKLYAHWSVIEYHIDFDTDKTLNNPDIPSITYTIDRGATLPNLSMNGYYFMGWADENYNLVKSVPKGSFGNMTLYPIWTSQRNSTHPNDYVSEGAAAITEWDDEEGNTNISFVYNIGTIENVPLYQIGEWMNGSGVEIVKEETVSKSFSKECAENIVKTVSDATTNSASWTISSEWNETLSEDRSLNVTATEEQIEASQNYYENNKSVCLSSGGGISGTVSSTDGRSSKTVDSLSEGGKVTVGCNYLGFKGEVEGHADHKYDKEKGETHEKTKSVTGYWNSDISHSASATAGGSSSFSKAISNSLSSSERYGKIVSNAIGQSNTSSSEQYHASSNSYSNTFVYSTDEVESTTIKYTLPIDAKGYYRRVLVGTAYVFAVVNYNFATQEFYVNTYSVIDDQSYNSYWDYSASTYKFDDHQLGVLPFAVPFEVNEYISNLTTTTEGLTVDKETGIINGYTGTDTGVIIPEYISYDNADKTHTSIKVTGIAPDAFAGNKDIVAVYLPDSVSEIPAGAFKDCTSLRKVEGKNIKSIGTKAFQNCTSLMDYTVGSSVTKLGNKAFEKVDSVTINASNSNVVSAACECGANSIVLNLKDCDTALENSALTIPNTAKYFKLEGAGKTLTNIQIVSNAETTEIQNVVMNNTIGRPLTISSSSLTIGSAKITAPSIAMVLLSDKTSITAYGQSTIVSNGEYAILSHDETYNGTGNIDIAKLNITGNIAVCGKVENQKYINIVNGKIVSIDEDEFDRLLNNITPFTLNKTELTLNTEGSSKTYQLAPLEENIDGIVWKSSDPSIASVSDNGLITALKDGVATITASVNGTSVSCNVTVKTAYTESWSAWSDWTTTKIEASDTVEVKTENRSSKVVVSYNMDSYTTRKANSTERQYRNFSVNGNYDAYGLSSQYGEYHNSWTYTVGEVNAATVIHHGGQQGGSQNGTNMADVDGYSMLYGGEYYIFFKTSENYDNVTTTYYSSRTLVKAPVVYTN
jgi:uncharacterized repeat protein (TIGR02543 family)